MNEPTDKVELGADLMRRLYAYRAMMAPHQKVRQGGALLIDAISELERLHGARGADSSAAPCLVIPAGNPEAGWTTDWDLIKSIAAEVRQKSGDQILLESLDDVIIALQRRGYVKVAPNA